MHRIFALNFSQNLLPIKLFYQLFTSFVPIALKKSLTLCLDKQLGQAKVAEKSKEITICKKSVFG
ncbi:hypothetical protein GXM_02670 [Nostoc sphaeroides CCNUC1]|uniref:Uncharacterized protein n=1 Tax=Nostoc sphaeroides CCNUC1 TaxID=2653204 RepID=A0A5P8VXN6_9NOSO|nr:hypothetical protein GXM_02670 [Nostoc sphaeroides CCNUC1]